MFINLKVEKLIMLSGHTPFHSNDEPILIKKPEKLCSQPFACPLLGGPDTTKPVFGVSDKVTFKPVSSATETS